ncbi:hypothetical protein M378DRAFT_172366 [Amanita muscaria Koide BX008]|uniref:Uncharacterized protein n=1 Tax=Amanita muscaria (strain Koide BX008) TaxID=946122 RepID=A0A0C2W6Q2_AMAMK|nr:hypothetical protein M378DRAFT_172366 [Amanita muscaria Koide BX008]
MNTSPPSCLRPPPPHSRLSPSISTVPTTQLTLDRLSVLCHPVFEQERFNNPMAAWAGIFGSVQRGTQRPDSNVNFLIGYAAGTVWGRPSRMELSERLSEILGREVDVEVFTQNDYAFECVHIEALLTAKTIWGDPPSWVHSSREEAERQLREGYETMKRALQVASRLEAKLPSSQAEFVLAENKALRFSILRDALLVIATVKTLMHPFYYELASLIPLLSIKENAIRAALEGEVENSEDLGDIWNVVSDWINVVAVEGVMQAAEQTFSRAGLVP